MQKSHYRPGKQNASYTTKNVLFPGHNHLLTISTAADDSTLIIFGSSKIQDRSTTTLGSAQSRFELMTSRS